MQHRPNPAYWEAVRKDPTAGLALFDQIPAGIPRLLPDPRTKQESFLSLEVKEITEQQKQVLRAVREHGPITDQDIAKITDLSLNVVNPRRGELVGLGHITLHDKVRSEETGRSRARWKVI